MIGSITFRVPGDAVSFTTKVVVFHKAGRKIRSIRKTDAAANWEAEVARAASVAMAGCGLLTGPVQVVWCAVFARKGKPAVTKDRPREYKTTKPDADKIERLIFDALSGIVYQDDNLVSRHFGQRITGYQGRRGTPSEASCTTITVKPLTEAPPEYKGDDR